MILIKWVVAVLSAMLRKGPAGVCAFGGSGAKLALFIEFNRFFILHMGGKRSTIRVSTLKEMK